MKPVQQPDPQNDIKRLRLKALAMQEVLMPTLESQTDNCSKDLHKSITRRKLEAERLKDNMYKAKRQTAEANLLQRQMHASQVASSIKPHLNQIKLAIERNADDIRAIGSTVFFHPDADVSKCEEALAALVRNLQLIANYEHQHECNDICRLQKESQDMESRRREVSIKLKNWQVETAKMLQFLDFHTGNQSNNEDSITTIFNRKFAEFERSLLGKLSEKP